MDGIAALAVRSLAMTPSLEFFYSLKRCLFKRRVTAMRIWIAIALAGLMLHACAHQNTYDTSCGQFTGTLQEYHLYLELCQTERFLAQQNASVTQQRAAAQWFVDRSHAEHAERKEQRFAPERIATELLTALAGDGLSSAPAMHIAIVLASCRAFEDHCTSIRNRLTTALVQPGRVTILERDKLATLHAEFALQRTPAFDQRTIARAGKRVGATHVLLLDIAPSANPWEAELLHVHARLVTVDLAIVVAASQRVFRP